MTKHETAEKYLRDGGCVKKCKECAFVVECITAHSYIKEREYGVEVANAYLTKQEKKMKKDDGWKELKIDDLPKDILVGDYEFQSNNGRGWCMDEGTPLGMLSALQKEIAMFRYRPTQKAQVSHEEIKESVDNILKESYNLIHELEVLNGKLERHKRL